MLEIMKAYVMSVMLFVLLIVVVAGIPTLDSQIASGFVNTQPDLLHVSAVPAYFCSYC
jgi:hypothetical protein